MTSILSLVESILTLTPIAKVKLFTFACPPAQAQADETCEVRDKMVSDELVPIKMRKQGDMGRAEVQAFHCGSLPHELPLAEWIKRHSEMHISCGTRVWLYRLESENGPLVGYGSIATGKVTDTSGNVVKGFQIPELALHRDYWGCPKGAEAEMKFSRQIVRHLQKMARQLQLNGKRERHLALYVHPDAINAQNLYESCGFTFADRYLPDITAPPPLLGLLGMDYFWSDDGLPR